MRVARQFAVDKVEVTLVTAQFPEDRSMVPEDFIATEDLDRSVLDEGAFQRPRQLPLLADILHRLYESVKADYLIYTNVDIGLLPSFYVVVDQIIEEGYDAFVINRRTISDAFTRVEDLPLMYGQVGLKHPGHDCFVFKREAYEKYCLGKVCIGMAWVAKALLVNMAYHALRFQVFEDEHLTFHIGDPRPWADPAYADYRAHNHKEFVAIRRSLREKFGKLVLRLPKGSNIPPMLEERVSWKRGPWKRVPWIRLMVKRVTPEPIYEAAKKVYRTIRPLPDQG